MSTDAIQMVLNQAENKCLEKGAKLTTKRKLVLQQLIESKRLLSAYDIVDRIKKYAKSSMPAMSVYRILDFLESVKLVHKLESQNKYIACRHIQCNHNHQSAQFLICNNCNYVKEINIEQSVMDTIGFAADDENFDLTFSVMEFKGLCHACQTQANQ